MFPVAGMIGMGASYMSLYMKLTILKCPSIVSDYIYKELSLRHFGENTIQNYVGMQNPPYTISGANVDVNSRIVVLQCWKCYRK